MHLVRRCTCDIRSLADDEPSRASAVLIVAGDPLMTAMNDSVPIEMLQMVNWLVAKKCLNFSSMVETGNYQLYLVMVDIAMFT